MPKKSKKRKGKKKTKTKILADVPEIQRITVNEKEDYRISERMKLRLSPKNLKNELPFEQFKLVHTFLPLLIKHQGGRQLLWKPLKSEEEILHTFKSWLREHDAAHGLEEIWDIAQTEYGRGVVALVDIKVGDPLLMIPETLFFSSEKAKKCPKYGHILRSNNLFLGNPSFMVVAFLLLHSIDPDSFWRPYIDALPRNEGLVLPSFMCSPEELNMINGLPVCDDISKLLINHLQLYFALRQIFNSFEIYPNLRWYDYAWAAAMVMTRQSGLDKGVITLIPGHDFVNCEQTGRSKSEFSEGHLRMLAESETLQGAQIFMDYGNRPSDSTLSMNGFVVEHNCYDYFSFQLALDDADPLHKLKTLQLQKRGILKPGDRFVSLRIYPSEKQLPELLLELARIQGLTRENIVTYMKKEGLGPFDSDNEIRAWASLQRFLEAEIETINENFVDEDVDGMTSYQKQFCKLRRIRFTIAMRVYELINEYGKTVKPAMSEQFATKV